MKGGEAHGQDDHAISCSEPSEVVTDYWSVWWCAQSYANQSLPNNREFTVKITANAVFGGRLAHERRAFPGSQANQLNLITGNRVLSNWEAGQGYQAKPSVVSCPLPAEIRWLLFA